MLMELVHNHVEFLEAALSIAPVESDTEAEFPLASIAIRLNNAAKAVASVLHLPFSLSPQK